MLFMWFSPHYDIDIEILFVKIIIKVRGVCGAVWFGFEAKNYSNCNINKYAVLFGSVDF